MSSTAVALCAFTLAALGAPAGAQVVLEPSVPVQGRIGPGETACHLVVTERGSQWRVTQTAFNNSTLEVGRGSCETMTTDLRAAHAYNLMDRVTRIDFAAGGGTYVLRTRGLNDISGAYEIRVDARPGVTSGGLLAPGESHGPWTSAAWTPASVSTDPANANERLSAGNIFKDCADVCPEMVVVSAGSFTMGSPPEEAGREPDEGPRHPVALTRPFAVGRYEVTFAEYDACVSDGGCSHAANDQGWGRGRRPVVDVSWNDAQSYVAWLSTKTGHRYQLPSEAEWEYAARAGSDTPWHTGAAVLTDDANILNAFRKTVTVGAYPPNRFGLADVHGNVSEWTLDCADTGYIGAPNDGSAAASGDCATRRVTRGGGFDSEPAAVRSASRSTQPQTGRGAGLGFRVTRAL